MTPNRISAMASLVLLTSSLACGLESTDGELELEPELAARSGDPTPCGDREFYVFDAINEQLDSDEGLRAFTRMEQVETCDEAREFVELKNEYGAELELPDEHPDEALPVEISPRIANGSLSQSRPSVELVIRQGPGYGDAILCSGSLIGPREIVTAAHCIYQDGPRPVKVTVRQALRGGGAQDVCVANCSNLTTSNATGYRHPSYTGLGDAGDDVAVIVLNADLPAPANQTSDWIRLMHYKTWNNAPLKIYGWGRNTQNGGSGVSREGDVVVSWSGSKHFTANATDARGCKGDSGGGAVREVAGDFPLSVGVLSEMAGSIGAGCPYTDGFNRWAHVGPKISWIENRIGRTCSDFVSASNPSITYARCW